MREGVIALDAGGTSVKSAVLDSSCAVLEGSALRLDFVPGAGIEQTLGTLALAASRGIGFAADHGLPLAAVGAAFPGPFDYRRGISGMTHKLPELRGVPLGEPLSRAAGGLPVRFLHDSTAFLLGEAFFGAARGARSPACVMLGTGLGFTYMRSGRVCLGRDLRPRTILWNRPFLEGTAEDYVSRRAIRARYALLSGAGEAPDVEAIAARAQAGDIPALETFRQMASLLARLLDPLLLALGCDRLVVGGGIARAAVLFMDELRRGLTVDAVPAAHPRDAALRGIARYCMEDGDALVEIGEREG